MAEALSCSGYSSIALTGRKVEDLRKMRLIKDTQVHFFLLVFFKTIIIGVTLILIITCVKSTLIGVCTGKKSSLSTIVTCFESRGGVKIQRVFP
jgi:hypothetical protein